MEFWRMPWPKAVALASLAAEQGSRNFAYAKFRAPHPPSPSSTRRASPWPKAVALASLGRRPWHLPVSVSVSVSVSVLLCVVSQADPSRSSGRQHLQALHM